MVDLNFFKSSPDEKSCKGIVARYKVSAYGGLNSIGKTERLNVLKRSSCSGCEKCFAILDCLKDSLDMDIGYFPDTRHLKNGDKVRVMIMVTSYDYGTGYPDDWEVQFIKV